MYKKIYDSGIYTLLDVREPIELISEGEVKNAINIPMRQIKDNLEQIKKMQLPIIVFCRSGNRSGKVMDFLHQNGIDEVYNGGGFQEVLDNLEY